MRTEQLLKCIGMIDDDLLTEADSYVPAPKIKLRYLAAAGSIAACLCIAAISIFSVIRNNNNGGLVLETTSETTVYDTTAPTEYITTDGSIDNSELPSETDSASQTGYVSAEPTDTMTSTEEITSMPQDTTANMTTVSSAEDIPEDDTDIAYEDIENNPDMPEFPTLAEYLDYFDAYSRSVKIGYEYIDPTFNVSIMKFIDVDISDVEAVLDKISGSSAASYNTGIKSRKIDSVIFLDGDNELFRITVGNDGKALLNPQNMEGSAVFEVPSEIYDEIYAIAAEIGGFSYFDDSTVNESEVSAD